MIKNYIKLAFKVMMRRKFFSFINLFGISLTLMILILVVAFLQNELGGNAPLENQDKMVFLTYLKKMRVKQDTIMNIDTTILDGYMATDTTYEYAENTESTTTGPFGMKIYKDYLSKMVEPELITIYDNGRGLDLFRNDKKVQLKAISVDPNYNKIFNFKFLEGGPLKSTSINEAYQELVISDEASQKYFGRTTDVIGEIIRIEGKDYDVVGLVEAVTNSKEFISADLYLPIGMLPDFVLNSEELGGPFQAVFLASSPERRKAIVEEINTKADQIDLASSGGFNVAELNGLTFMEVYAWSMLGGAQDVNIGERVRSFYLIVIGVLLLFILLPTLNLISLNVTRILDRSSEIGVRKAFGANNMKLLNQFIFENIVITVIGGIIGLILASFALHLINDSKVLGDTVLVFNWQVFVLSLFVVLFFGVISGFIPAWRMSKLPIVNALKMNS